MGKLVVTSQDLLNHLPAPLTQVMAHADHVVEVFGSHLDIRLTLDPDKVFIQKKTFTNQ